MDNALLDPGTYRAQNAERYSASPSCEIIDEMEAQDRFEGGLDWVESVLMHVKCFLQTFFGWVGARLREFCPAGEAEHEPSRTLDPAPKEVTLDGWNRQALQHRHARRLDIYPVEMLLAHYARIVETKGNDETVLAALDDQLVLRLLSQEQLARWQEFWSQYHQARYQRLHAERRRLVTRKFAGAPLTQFEIEDLARVEARIDALDSRNPNVRRANLRFESLRSGLVELERKVGDWTEEGYGVSSQTPASATA